MGVNVLRSVLKSLFSRADAESAAPDLRAAQDAHARGDVESALALVRERLARMPGDAAARYCAGRWLAQAGRTMEAQPHLEQAVEGSPADPDAWLVLGNVRRALGDAAGAESCYRRAVALAPDSAGAQYNLGLVLKVASVEAALPHFQRACALAPDFEDAQVEYVLALVGCERYTDAIEVGERAIERNPASGRLAAAAGYALQKVYRSQEALACYQTAEKLRAADHELWNNRGIVLQDLGRMDEALIAYSRALEVHPGFAPARFHRGLAHLAQRQYAIGWDDYEVRFLVTRRDRAMTGVRPWCGESLKGHSIRVLGEQGLGDEIMFASCFPDIVQEARAVTIVCAPRLVALFARSFPRATVIATGSEHVHTLPADFCVHAGTLPRYLRPSQADFPRHAGYLRAAPERVAYWRQRLAALGPGRKYGISWRGGTHQTRAPLRSIPLNDWGPLFAVPDMHYVSLQYGDSSEALKMGSAIAVWPEAIDDYDETAALVAALDGVISVCTAIVHLAGALGRPAWVMVPASPEWRYGAVGEHMDWYPSVRVFRQTTIGEWSAVVRAVAHGLHEGALADRADIRQDCSTCRPGHSVGPLEPN